MNEHKPSPYETVYAGKTKDGLRLNLHGEGYIPTGDGMKIIVMEGAIVTREMLLTPDNTFSSAVEAAFRLHPKYITMGHAGKEIQEDDILYVDPGTWAASLSRF